MKPSKKQPNSNNNSEDDDNGNGGGNSSARTICLPYAEGRPDLPTYLARFSRTLSSHSTTTTASCDTTHSSTTAAADVEGFEPSSGEITGEIVGGRKGPLGTPMGGLVFACGPPGLVETARGSAEDAGMDFRSEVFEL